MNTERVKGPVRVRTLNQEFRKLFGCRVHKVPVHSGLSCPNRDGRLGRGGCLYCGPQGGAAVWSDPEQTVTDQLVSGIAFARRRFQASKFVAYFQPYTNTDAPVDRLQRIWDEAVGIEGVVGLSIGTRPDCLPDDVLDLIHAYHLMLPYVSLELGLQTAHDRTLRRIGRGHDLAAFEDAVSRAQNRGIPLCVHLILGLPGESVSEMMETVQLVLDMGIQGVKLHHLHVLKGSALEQDYLRGEVDLLSMKEYVDLVCRVLEMISGRMVVHRFMGEAHRDRLVAPLWTNQKRDVLGAVFETLEQGGSAEAESQTTRQGKNESQPQRFVSVERMV